MEIPPLQYPSLSFIPLIPKQALRDAEAEVDLGGELAGAACRGRWCSGVIYSLHKLHKHVVYENDSASNT
jgi:hypothetical protein